jgi:hypothetical protein
MRQGVKAKTMSFTDGEYFSQAFGDVDQLYANAERVLKHLKIDFDSMVAIGLSGHMVLPVLARYFDVPFLALRKPGTYTHDDFGIGKFGRGTIGNRWILVDDFICSGNTVRTAQERVSGALAHLRDRGYDSTFSTEFVGTYCYGTRYGDPEPGHFVYPDMQTKKGISLVEIDGVVTPVDSQAYGRMRNEMAYFRERKDVDPKGKAIAWYKDYCYCNEQPFNLDEATTIAVAAERFLTENPNYRY